VSVLTSPCAASSPPTTSPAPPEEAAAYAPAHRRTSWSPRRNTCRCSKRRRRSPDVQARCGRQDFAEVTLEVGSR
jgi:hypothetical protein